MSSTLKQMQILDSEILTILNDRPEEALRKLYSSYYNFVCGVIYKMIGDGAIAEDIAQEVFVEVWKRRDRLAVSSSLRGYLRKVAVNKTLNHIRSHKVNFEQEDVILHIPTTEDSPQHVLEARDLQSVITEAVDSLPEKCRLVFGLSRFEELSYREISEKLNVSIKTVENQMSKALKNLRLAVHGYQAEKI